MWQMTFLTVPSPPHQPWQLLLCCIFLNQTTRNQLDVVLMHFLERWNTPEKLLQARQDEIEGVIAPLGLQRRRTETVLRFTKEFLEKDWTDPLDGTDDRVEEVPSGEEEDGTGVAVPRGKEAEACGCDSGRSGVMWPLLAALLGLRRRARTR